METRANYIAVGFVTLLMMVLAFLFVLWLCNSTGSGERSLLDVRIRGSVSGLTQGSSVQFNGIDVGRVVGLQLDANDPRFVIARTEILSSVPVRSDTSASIGVRGLSGGAFIQLQGGTKDAIALLQTPTPDGSPPVILGDPSTMTELMARVNQNAGKSPA